MPFLGAETSIIKMQLISTIGRLRHVLGKVWAVVKQLLHSSCDESAEIDLPHWRHVPSFCIDISKEMWRVLLIFTLPEGHQELQ